MARESVFRDSRYLSIVAELRGLSVSVDKLRSNVPQALELLRHRLDALQGAIRRQRRIKQFGDAVSLGLIVVDIALGPLVAAPLRLATKVG